MKEENNVKSAVIEAMLRLAKQLQKEGRVREACELYLKIMEEAPQSQEAAEAQRALLSLAEEYEKQGMIYSALDLYQKLMEKRNEI